MESERPENCITEDLDLNSMKYLSSSRLPLGYVRENAYESKGNYPKAGLCYSAVYDRAYSNYYYVNMVYGVYMTNSNTNTNVNVLNSQYTIIDGRRTIAANYSSNVTVKSILGVKKFLIGHTT